MFILRQGEAVARMQGSSGELQVAKYGPGDFFGEIALLLGQPRQASVYAIGYTICLYISREQFNRLLGPLRDILKKNIDKYEKYGKFLLDDVNPMGQNPSLQSTPRQPQLEVYDGTWEKYKLRGQTFRKKVAKTFANLPEAVS